MDKMFVRLDTWWLKFSSTGLIFQFTIQMCFLKLGFDIFVNWSAVPIHILQKLKKLETDSLQNG
jgi:hypothetical protein